MKRHGIKLMRNSLPEQQEDGRHQRLAKQSHANHSLQQIVPRKQPPPESPRCQLSWAIKMNMPVCPTKRMTRSDKNLSWKYLNKSKFVFGSIWTNQCQDQWHRAEGQLKSFIAMQTVRMTLLAELDSCYLLSSPMPNAIAVQHHFCSFCHVLLPSDNLASCT